MRLHSYFPSKNFVFWEEQEILSVENFSEVTVTSSDL